MNKMQLFDHYSFRARLQPALFTLLPLALGVLAWTGTKKTLDVYSLDLLWYSRCNLLLRCSRPQQR